VKAAVVLILAVVVVLALREHAHLGERQHKQKAGAWPGSQDFISPLCSLVANEDPSLCKDEIG
jgi:hypothetical protein